jgi:predicted  nucleic acid-binding Zn-ribbon protein
MTEKEKMIQHFMKKLKCSREDAEKIWQDDLDDVAPELTAEQKAVEKEMRQADRKKETAPRKRERKPDENKRALMTMLETMLVDVVGKEDVNITNPERELEFVFMGDRYRLTLAKPRKEKK